MNKNDAYIYYSGATDITGKKLVEALSITGGNKKPAGAKVVIGWGAKTKDDVKFPKGTVVINHPDAIRDNRNKFKAMEIMKNKLPNNIPNYTVAGSVLEAIGAGTVALPLIGRTKFHQGGKGFWTCPTMAQVDAAIEAGAHHFCNMVPIKDEYRLHVFSGEIIHAQKKVKRSDEDFEKAFIEDELARQKSLAEKNNDPFDEATAALMLRRQAKNATAGGANMMLRSNKMGWKFGIVKKKASLKFVEDNMKKIAVDAIDALGLTFGAVDCCVDTDNNVFIFEVNSGPGLEATSFDKYVEAFKIIMKAKTTKPAKPAVKASKAGGSSKSVRNISSEKDVMKKQLSDLQGLLDEVDDDAEFAAIKKLGAKLIFGGQ